MWILIFLNLAAAIIGSITGTLAVLGLFLLIVYNSKGNRRR